LRHPGEHLGHGGLGEIDEAVEVGRDAERPPFLVLRGALLRDEVGDEDGVAAEQEAQRRLRAVATRRWPLASTACASARPRPRELPVTSQTCGVGMADLSGEGDVRYEGGR